MGYHGDFSYQGQFKQSSLGAEWKPFLSLGFHMDESIKRLSDET